MTVIVSLYLLNKAILSGEFAVSCREMFYWCTFVTCEGDNFSLAPVLGPIKHSYVYGMSVAVNDPSAIIPLKPGVSSNTKTFCFERLQWNTRHVSHSSQLLTSQTDKHKHKKRGKTKKDKGKDTAKVLVCSDALIF